MNHALELMAAYLLRVGPGLFLAAAVLFLFRRDPRLRIAVYLALFIFLRDAMTPLGLWSFGDNGFFWIRLIDEPLFLMAFGVSSLGMSLALYHFDRANQPLVRWTRCGLPLGLLLGLAGMVVVVAPLAVSYQFVPIESRGGAVPRNNLAAVLLFAMLGNLLEELLFRGYVLGHLAERMTPMAAGVASGVVFSFCHIYLAATVTGIGLPLLAFTLWEGTIAGLVGSRGGVIPSTLTHGGAIFLLSSGLF